MPSPSDRYYFIEAAPLTGKGDLLGIARARALSRHTMSDIKQNLFVAFAD